MLTTIKASGKFRFYAAAVAVAALIITLLAVSVAGPTMAQEPRTGDNAAEYDDPLPCSEEVEPDASTAELIRDGYYAVFDGFWDYEVGHLSNNFCPPGVTEKTKDDGLGNKVTVNTRSDANIHISKTVFSIPDSYKVTVVDSQSADGNPSNVQGPTIDLSHFPFLKNGGAVSAGDSLYWVRPETSPLQIGFSTALMDKADWFKDENEDRASDGPPVQFRFAAVHVLQDGTPVEAHVLGAHIFAFDPGASQSEPQWSNVKTNIESEIEMETGQYRRMQFAFTKPGQYLVQAQVQGHVRNELNRLSDAPGDWSPVSSDVSITSPVQWYTFHVGSEADLDVSLTAGSVSGSAVPVTVTANNSGPNDAENVEVEINLPAGLSAPATLPSGAFSSGCGAIAWEIGTVRSGASPTLSFNAIVDPGAAGKVTATAEVRSTTFEPDVADNTDSAEVTLSGTRIRPPFFPGVSRTIVEHAVAGAHAGDPVAAVSPEGRALTYSLSGTCSNKFQVHPNGQIVLAYGHTLNYEQQWEYPLTLHVSDGVNASGGADSSIDDSTPVLIRVEDTLADAVHPTVTFTLSNPDPDPRERHVDLNHPVVGYTVNVNAHVHNLPAGATPTYLWDNPPGIAGLPERGSYYPAAAFRAGPETYRVHVKWDGGGMTASYTIEWYTQ